MSYVVLRVIYTRMEQITANLAGKLRRENLNGREHLVVPMTLIVPGVLNGSQGPLLYSAEELAKDPGIWNGVPIVLHHPKRGGVPISARDPDILNTTQLGVVMRSRFDKKLVAEGWFDVEATRRIDNSILGRLETNTPSELSTGLGTDFTAAPNGSEFEGTPFDFIATNFRPDHLAILPDAVGACSIDDGCGVLVNDNNENDPSKATESEPTKDTHETETLLNNLKEGESVLVSTPTPVLIMNKLATANSNVMFRWEIKGDRKHSEITRLTENEMADLSEKKKSFLVSSIIANCDCWSEEDKDVLNGFSDKKLTVLNKSIESRKSETLVANEAMKDYSDVEGNLHVFNAESKQWETEFAKKEPVVNEPVTPKVTEPAPAQLSDDQLAVINYGKKAMERDKISLIEKLIANVSAEDRNGKIKEFSALEIPVLELMASILPEPQPVVSDDPVLNYFGSQGGGNVENVEFTDDDILSVPTYTPEAVKA